MLGAGLRREFPGAFAWAARARRRVPRPRVARSGPAWAVLAGLGANALVAALLGSSASAILSFIDLPRDWQAFPAVRAGAIAFAGVAVGAAVARRSGGWPALLGFAGTLAVLALINVGLAAPGLALFCERIGAALLDICTRGPLEELVARWPLIAGLVFSLAVVARLGTGPRGTNAPFEAIGAAVALEPATRVMTLPFFPPLGEATMGFVAVTSALFAAVALGAGHLLVRRGGRPWPSAVVVALVYFIAPWVPSLLLYARFSLSTPQPEYAWLLISPVAYALAFLLGAVVTAALARSPRPDGDASRRAAR